MDKKWECLSCGAVNTDNDFMIDYPECEECKTQYDWESLKELDVILD